MSDHPRISIQNEEEAVEYKPWTAFKIGERFRAKTQPESLYIRSTSGAIMVVDHQGNIGISARDSKFMESLKDSGKCFKAKESVLFHN